MAASWHLVAALDAVAASASKLRTDLNGREQMDLLFSPRIVPALDAMDNYTCH
jgi:hypothetical protein